MAFPSLYKKTGGKWSKNGPTSWRGKAAWHVPRRKRILSSICCDYYFCRVFFSARHPLCRNWDDFFPDFHTKSGLLVALYIERRIMMRRVLTCLCHIICHVEFWGIRLKGIANDPLLMMPHQGDEVPGKGHFYNNATAISLSQCRQRTVTVDLTMRDELEGKVWDEDVWKDFWQGFQAIAVDSGRENIKKKVMILKSVFPSIVTSGSKHMWKVNHVVTKE